MEVFVDFGLFELAAAVGAAAVARRVYAHKLWGTAFALLGVAAPFVLILVSHNLARWIAVFAFATSLVNAAVVLQALMRGWMPSLLSPARAHRESM